ncbi:hypothetical protein E1287_37510 [Actinomadura sp. KC06]|uniref:hypothetical protein n=1 Tax=Actinomadura sp. KC06 TaxID=2530369 RepID=UPI0010476C96|nr:hypothetical protein [Actinomadura sp. KC06]TDD25212.1 hypothetical protein E1287_37510 [Actinomadura sp. KC06]
MTREPSEKWWKGVFLDASAQIAAGILIAIALALSSHLLNRLTWQSVTYMVYGLAGLALCTGGIKAVKIRKGLTQRGRRYETSRVELPGQESLSSGKNGLDILADESIGATGLHIRIRDTELKASPQVVSNFVHLNTRREAAGLMGYYDAIRYLPVTTPRQRRPDGPYEMDVVRVDYSLIALVNDAASPTSVRESVTQRIDSLSDVDPEIRSEWHEDRVGLLGTQLCVITSDKKILLRKRGANVLFARNRWDVSVSGFCGTVDVDGDSTLNPCLTAEHETLREIGHVRADPRELRLTGVTRNKNTGAFDILMAWQTDTDSSDLMGLLTAKSAQENQVFATDIKAIERYVWDSKNLLVSLNRDDIEFAWHRCDIDVADFEPQSLLCLDLTLKIFANDQEQGFLRQRGVET